MDHVNDLDHTLARFEAASNGSDFGAVAPLLAPGAVYWFTDGSYEGVDAIRHAFEATWRTIQGETYAIDDLRWLAVSDTVAACVYGFRSEGTVDGRPFSATGRGTNVLIRTSGGWKIVHEHLSADPDARRSPDG